MKKAWLLAAGNLRKGKGQAASFLVMVLLASALLNLGLVTALNYSEAFDRRAKELNSADVMVVLQDTDKEYSMQLETDMREDPRTAQLESRAVLYLGGTCGYGDGETTRKFAVLEQGQEGDIGRIAYLEKGNHNSGRAVYLPYLFRTGGGYQLGDIFSLTVANGEREEKFQYTVAGFFEESMLGTINSTTTGLILDKEGYRELSDKFAGRMDGTMLLAQLKDREDGETYCAEHTPEVPPEQALSDVVYYRFARQSRTVTSSIGSMIVVAFSFIIAAVALVVVRFRIGNSIEEDMRNLGALKAIGYESRQIMLSILLQFLSVGALGALMGLGLSYGVLPMLSDMFAAQTGVLWEQGFDPVSSGIALAILLAAVTLVTLVSARKVRTLTPIVALRSGILTHSFKRNPLPLEKGRGPLFARLAGKTFFQEIKRNLLVGAIIAAISFTAVFAGVMHYNAVVKVDNFLRSCTNEIFSLQADTVSPKAMKEVLSYMEKLPQVEKAFPYTTVPVRSGSGTQIFCYLTPDFSRFDNQNTAYEGRFPKYENEVAIGGLIAGDLGKKPGDSIELSVNGNKAEYLITGLIQGSNFMGRDAAMTEDGFRRLSPDFEPITLAVYLNAETEPKEFIELLKEEKGDKIAVTYDYKKIIEASLGTYQGIIGVLVIVIVMVTLAVVALTLYLVVKTLLLRKRRELGIQKAVGFTTRQLVLQTALSFLPVLLLGSALGCTAGYFLVNPLLSVLFSGIGMMKMAFEILPGLLVGAALGITLFGLLITALVAARIRKITPYALVSE